MVEDTTWYMIVSFSYHDLHLILGFKYPTQNMVLLSKDILYWIQCNSAVHKKYPSTEIPLPILFDCFISLKILLILILLRKRVLIED